MTDQTLRKIAEAEAAKRVIKREPSSVAAQSWRIGNELGFVEGFIAGRTSVTREQIAEVLERKLGHAHRDAPYADLTEEADAVLALLRGEVTGG